MKGFYIRKRQKISIGFIGVALLASIITHSPSYLTYMIITYMIIVLSLSYTPSLSKFGVPKIVLQILDVAPTIIPILLLNLNRNVFTLTVKDLILGITTGIILLLIDIKGVIKYLKNGNSVCLIKQTKEEFRVKAYKMLFMVIGEEFYFRLYLLESLKNENIVLIALITALLFTYTHYLNRWATRVSNIKSYVQHFTVGMATATLYLYTGSIIACIIAHLEFNMPYIINEYKRTKIDQEEVSFNDY